MRKRKDSDKDIRLFTLDTETRGLFGEIFRAGLYDGCNYFVSNDFQELFDIVQSYTGLYECHVYVHNLDFDLAKVAKTLYRNCNIIFDDSIFINSNAVTVTTETMTFHDSLRILPASLDKLSKDFGLTTTAKYDLTEYIKEKGYAIFNEDGSYNPEESKNNFFMNVPADDEVLNFYLKLDCVALYDILMLVLEISGLDLERFILCPTTASLAMGVYRNNYPEQYKTATTYKWLGKHSEWIENFIRCGYYGGRTEVFKPFMDNGFHYDINSLYPYCMKNYAFPVGFPQIYEQERAGYLYRTWKRTGTGGGFLFCKIHVPETLNIPPLPKKDPSGKLLFPVGNLQGVWTFPEIQQAERMGCTIDEYLMAVYFKQTEYIFKDFVSYFEEIKINSKGAKRTFAKLMQNSLYGKFGMNRLRGTYTDFENLQTVKETGRPYRIITHSTNFDVKFIEYITDSKASYIQPQIASYVTAYARLILLDGLLKQKDPYYCDTDSIATLEQFPPEMVHDSAYGKWKLESVIEQAIFLQPKFYAERGQDFETLHAKGIPSKIIKGMTYDNFVEWSNAIKAGAERLHIFDNLPARNKFISSLKNNDDVDKVTVLKKSINLLMEQKRIIDYNANTTHPHKRYDYGEGIPSEDVKPFDYFKKKLLQYDDDISKIKQDIDEYGYIKIPAKGTEEHRKYMILTPNARRKYFRQNGIELEKWTDATGWNVDNLFSEMGV